jgi:hypothetical protein
MSLVATTDNMNMDEISANGTPLGPIREISFVPLHPPIICHPLQFLYYFKLIIASKYSQFRTPRLPDKAREKYRNVILK